MLAQSFMTAADLNIKEPERDALIKVLGMFERGDLAARGDTRDNYVGDSFHMGSVVHSNYCGTCACVLGWCRIVAHDDDLFEFNQAKDRTYKLYSELFLFGDARRFTINDPQRAAVVLRRYLTTGEANWFKP